MGEQRCVGPRRRARDLDIQAVGDSAVAMAADAAAKLDGGWPSRYRQDAAGVGETAKARRKGPAGLRRAIRAKRVARSEQAGAAIEAVRRRITAAPMLLAKLRRSVCRALRVGALKNPFRVHAASLSRAALATRLQLLGFTQRHCGKGPDEGVQTIKPESHASGPQYYRGALWKVRSLAQAMEGTLTDREYRGGAPSVYEQPHRRRRRSIGNRPRFRWWPHEMVRP
jgi:hypothetical protein